MEASHTEYLCRKYEKASMPQNKGQNRSWRLKKKLKGNTIHCCSVVKSCQTLCDPVDCSMPGFRLLPSPGVCSNSRSLSQWCSPYRATFWQWGGKLFSCLFLRFPYCKPLSSFFRPSSSFQPGRGRVSLCLVNEEKSVETNPCGIAYTSLVLPRSGVDSKSA